MAGAGALSGLYAKRLSRTVLTTIPIIAGEARRREKHERLRNATASHVELVRFERGDWPRARRRASPVTRKRATGGGCPFGSTRGRMDAPFFTARFSFLRKRKGSPPPVEAFLTRPRKNSRLTNTRPCCTKACNKAMTPPVARLRVTGGPVLPSPCGGWPVPRMAVKESALRLVARGRASWRILRSCAPRPRFSARLATAREAPFPAAPRGAVRSPRR